MTTYATAAYLIAILSGSTAQNRAYGEYFPALEKARLAGQMARSAARYNRLRSGWKAICDLPHLVIGQAARLVPASIKAAWNAGTEAKALAINIRRLEKLSPHLLADIGIEQVAGGVYAQIETDETLAEGPSPKPAVVAFKPKPAARAAKSALHRLRRPSARRARLVFAGAVSLKTPTPPDDQPGPRQSGFVRSQTADPGVAST